MQSKQINLEPSANELLLDIFEFLPTDELIHAFHGLNRRFRRKSCVLRSIYSEDFDIICRTYLPSLIDKLPALYFSEDSSFNSPLERFEAHGLTFGHFVQLTSLSVSHLMHSQLMNHLLLALPQLIHLTHLTLNRCGLTDGEWGDLSTVLPLMNCIWSLPKMTHCLSAMRLARFFHHLLFY